jgi:hypothetical protein
MTERKDLAKLFGIETSFKEVSIRQMPTKDIEYFEERGDLERRFLKWNRDHTKTKTYIAFKLKNVKANRSRIFYSFRGNERSHINHVFYSFVKECYWYFASAGKYEMANDVTVARSKTHYSKLKFVFGKDFSEFLHEATETMIAEGLDMELMTSTLTMMPDTSDKTIKLLLAHLTDNDDEYLIERLMNHPAAKNLVAFK